MQESKSGLSLPEKGDSEANTPEPLTPQAIEEWKNQLSKTELSTSSKTLYHLLNDIQQTTLPSSQRFMLLSSLQPILNSITLSLQNLSDFEAVSGENHYLIADLIIKLNTKMLSNYKLIIETEMQLIFSSKKRLLFALQNAMTQCVKILFYAYEQYRSPPPGLWFDLHSLYAFAQRKRLLNKNVQKNPNWDFSYKTLAHLYKHCLLFYITNPYHFAQQELVEIKYALETWAPLLEIRKADAAISPLFGVDISSDAPPQYASVQAHYPASYYFLILDNINKRLLQLLSLKKNLKKVKTNQVFSTAELALTTTFVEFLLNRWSAMQNKFGKREKIQGYIKSCLGISASHWFLNKESGCSNIPNPDVSDSTETLDVDALLRQHASLHGTAQDGKPQYQTFNCELVNQSPGGYCLKWGPNYPAQLKSGEVITLEQPVGDNEHRWVTGTIRWLKQKKDLSALIGVQILSTETFPAKAYLVEVPNALPIPTLLLPEQPSQTVAMKTLITPPLPFKSGQKIELEYNNERFVAILQKNYSLSSAYQQFGLDFESKQPDFPPSTHPL